MPNDMLKGAREALLEAKTAVDGIASGFKVDEKGNFDLSTKQYNDYTAAVKRANEAKSFIDSVEAMDQIGSYLDAPEGKSYGALDAGQADARADEVKSLADVFIGSEEYKAAVAAGNFRQVGRIHAEMEGKSLHSLSAGTHTRPVWGQAQDLGFQEKNRRKTRIRDLFPKATTRASILYGVVESGWVNNAQQVRQRYAGDGTYNPTTGLYTPGGNHAAFPAGGDQSTGFGTEVYGLKPKSKIMVRPITYPIATIAHTLDSHRNLLDDEPRLKAFINNRLTEGVKFAEDEALLHSVGGANSEEITGLFNVPGRQTFTGNASDKFSVQIRRAITKAQLAEYDPTGIVISPELWEAIETEEDGQGGFRVAVNVSVGAVKQVWHLDVVATTAMNDNQFVLGAFGMGAQLWDREAVSCTMSTENRDNYERNVVTFRAEERVGLEVPRPESFVIGTFTDYVAA